MWDLARDATLMKREKNKFLFQKPCANVPVTDMSGQTKLQ